MSAVGIALILIAVSNLALFFFGDSATAGVTTRRYGGTDNGRHVSQRYAWYVNYTFKDKAGNLYSGHVTRRGNDISVKTENKVYYFTFAPYVNALEGDAEPNFVQLLYAVAGAFLLFVMNRKNTKISRKRNTLSDSSCE